MQYSTLISSVHSRCGYSTKVVDAVLTAAWNIIAEELSNWNEVRLLGVGTLHVREYKGRDFHPVCGQTITVLKPYKRVQFRANQRLKDAVNRRT